MLQVNHERKTDVYESNPVILGEAVTDKEFRLDINIVLNNHILINLEMQIANKLNWQNRSIMYLCRSFDQLNHSQNYSEAKSVIHIVFLDYTLFEDHPEFYSTYKLINVKNHKKYSDSLTLHVIDLSHIDLATNEDKKHHIHEWAMLFKATTWEEVKMLASTNKYFQEASDTIFRMSADDLVRKRCRDREEYYQDLRNYEMKIEQNRLEHEQAIRENEAKHQQSITEKDALISQLLAENEALRQQLK